MKHKRKLRNQNWHTFYGFLIGKLREARRREIKSVMDAIGQSFHILVLRKVGELYAEFEKEQDKIMKRNTGIVAASILRKKRGK